VKVYLHSPEDLILDKLWYYSLSRQTKHPRDMCSIIKSVGETLDFEHISSWAKQRGLTAIWQELLDQLASRSGSEEG
jgi:hypothetical protein